MSRVVIVDCRASRETVNTLERMGYAVIPTALIGNVYDAVASHADIQIYYLGNGSFVCAPEVYDHYRRALPETVRLIRGTKSIGKKYPFDIPYNAARLKDFVICAVRYTDLEIVRDKSIINVRQGYSKCSTCVVNGSAIITADSGIAAEAEKRGVDALRITAGHILLRGMDYGFIGGATGLIEKDVLAVNGEIIKHPDGEAVKSFCKQRGVEIIELKKGVPEDIGTVVTNLDF